MMEQVVFQFLDAHIDTKRPVLLALSGGADSMCLFHLLMEWRKQHPLSVAIAHVDHGWRKESAEEAAIIQKLAEKYHLPFYLKVLDPADQQGNLELASRNARYHFFLEVIQQIKAQAVLVAHHLNDQAETVLKRILEGASLSHLSAMQAVSRPGELVLMRPLLAVTKQQIVQYMTKRDESFFYDPTNDDTRFLRGRMRQDILPYLRKAFGKECDRNLCHIAEDAARMRNYFDSKMKPYLDSCISSDIGVLFDISKCSFHSVEAYELLRSILEKAAVVFSRIQMRTGASYIVEKVANKWLESATGSLYFDRGRIFVFKNALKELSYGALLHIGVQMVGPYTVTVEEVAACGEIKNHWIDLFKGECVTFVPKGSYSLVAPSRSLYRVDSSNKSPRNLSRLVSEHKVPSIMQKIAPFLCLHDEDGSSVYEDFLLGLAPLSQGGSFLKISFSR